MQDNAEKSLVVRQSSGTELTIAKPGKISKRRSVTKYEVARIVKRIDWLTEDEYMRMMTAASHSEHRLLMRVLWETGSRISELLGLTYANIYPDGLNIVGKGKKQRFIPCQAPVLGELLRYRETHGQEKVFQKITTESGALLMLRRVARAASIDKRVYPHLFRHSFAINFIQQTGNPFALQDIGGWSDMETIKIYMRLAKEAPKEAIKRMNFPIVESHARNRNE